MVRYRFCCLLLVFLIASLSSGQTASANAEVTGIVKDLTGALVPEANVQLLSPKASALPLQVRTRPELFGYLQR